LVAISEMGEISDPPNFERIECPKCGEKFLPGAARVEKADTF